MADRSDRALPWQILGRDVRPATFFLALNTCWVAAAALRGDTIMRPPAELPVGIIGVLAGLFMLAAWWAKSLPMMALGLAATSWFWLTVALSIYLIGGDRNGYVSGFGALCWAGVAGGLWLRDHKERPPG